MTIWKLNRERLHFIVPLGNGDWFREITSPAIPPERIIELDWWDDTIVTAGDVQEGETPKTPYVKVTCTPAQHNSGKWKTSKNRKSSKFHRKITRKIFWDLWKIRWKFTENSLKIHRKIQNGLWVSFVGQLVLWIRKPRSYPSLSFPRLFCRWHRFSNSRSRGKFLRIFYEFSMTFHWNFSGPEFFRLEVSAMSRFRADLTTSRSTRSLLSSHQCWSYCRFSQEKYFVFSQGESVHHVGEPHRSLGRSTSP